MHTYADKKRERQEHSPSASLQKSRTDGAGYSVQDNRPEAIQMRAFQEVTRYNAARQSGKTPGVAQKKKLSAQKAPGNVAQLTVFANENALWNTVTPDIPLASIRAIINGNAELQAAYDDSLLNLNRMNFVDSPGTQPIASYAMNHPANTYDITYGLRNTQAGNFRDQEVFIGAIIHEMGHVNSGLQYNTNIPEGEVYHISNMHLPAPTAPLFGGTAVGMNQRNDPASGWVAQEATMQTNWDQLMALRTNDHGFTNDEIVYLTSREGYAKGMAPATHYDTVLADILYYLQHRGLTETHYYIQATAMLNEANVRRRAGAGDVALVGLVAAPANRFLQLYNAVSTLLNNAHWSNEGEAFIGTKTPDGITRMRALLDPANKRVSLNRIKALADIKIAQPDRRRSANTTLAYNLLSQVDLRNNFLGLIGNLTGCNAGL